IVYAYSGIRPLPASDASNPGLISRDHSAPVIEPAGGRTWPIISLVGGKWTTFRGFAEEVADTVLSRLDKARSVSTRDLPIGGGRGFPTDEADRERWAVKAVGQTGVGADRARALLDRYGSTAHRALEHEAEFGSQTLADAPGYTIAEL